jgi:hypothetical protein
VSRAARATDRAPKRHVVADVPSTGPRMARNNPSPVVCNERRWTSMSSSAKTPPMEDSPCPLRLSAVVERRAWDSNPRGRFRALAVFKTAAIGH